MSTALNNLRNGSRITRLALGKLPAKLSRVERRVMAYRRSLEDAVVEACGEVDTVKAHLINACCEHLQHGLICRWVLRQRLADMSVQDVLACSRSIAQAADSRNRAVDRLGLETSGTDIIKTLLYERHEDDSSEGLATDETADVPDALDAKFGDESKSE